MDYWVCTLLTGIGATAVVDLWAIVRKHLLGIPPPNYGLVGRWLSAALGGELLEPVHGGLAL